MIKLLDPWSLSLTEYGLWVRFPVKYTSVARTPSVKLYMGSVYGVYGFGDGFPQKLKLQCIPLNSGWSGVPVGEIEDIAVQMAIHARCVVK